MNTIESLRKDLFSMEKLGGIPIILEGDEEGFLIDLNNVDKAFEKISLVEILSMMGRIKRFNNNPKALSVLQHSVIMVLVYLQDCDESGKKPLTLDVMRLLLHDAHEIVTGDISTPIKKLIGRKTIKGIENRIDSAIFSAHCSHGAFWPRERLVMDLDLASFYFECQNVVGGAYAACVPYDFVGSKFDKMFRDNYVAILRINNERLPHVMCKFLREEGFIE